MIAVTHYNPASREAVTTVHGPSDPDRREWERQRAARFVAETAPAGTIARHEFRTNNIVKLSVINGRA